MTCSFRFDCSDYYTAMLAFLGANCEEPAVSGIHPLELIVRHVGGCVALYGLGFFPLALFLNDL